MLNTVTLKKGNLLIPQSVLPASLIDSTNVLVSYVKEQDSIVIADAHNANFVGHFPNAQQQLLKLKNPQGDRVIACHDILLDYRLDAPEGELSHRRIHKETILQIYLNAPQP